MRILFVSYEMPCPANNGFRITCLNTVRSLLDGNDCHYLSVCGSDGDVQATQKEFPSLTFETVKPVKNSKLIMTLKALLTGKSPAVYSGFNKKFAALVKRTLKKNSYDLVYLFGIQTVFLGRYISDTPAIISVSDALSETYRRLAVRAKTPLRRWYYGMNARRIRAIERRQYPRFAAVVAVSPVDAQILRQGRGVNVLEIPIMADEAFFADKPESSKTRISYLTNLADPQPYTGFIEFASLLKDFLAQHSDVEFNAVLRNAPADILACCPVADNLRIHNYVDDIVGFMLETDILVALDRVGTGLKNRVLQGFAAGACVVGTPVALEGFPYNNGVHACCGETTEMVAERVRLLGADKEQARKIGENARALAREHYSFGIIGKRLRGAVESIVTAEHIVGGSL